MYVQQKEISINPIGAGGQNVPSLFSDGYFSMKKGFCHSVFGVIYVEGVGTLRPPALQLHSKTK